MWSIVFFLLQLNTCKGIIITYSATGKDASGRFIVIINYVLLLARFHLSVRIGQKNHTHTHFVVVGSIIHTFPQVYKLLLTSL